MLVHSFIEETQVGVSPVVVCYLQVHNLHIQVHIKQHISTLMNQFNLKHLSNDNVQH